MRRCGEGKLLKHLGIGASIKQLNKIELGNLQELQTLEISWRKKISGLESCKKLSFLTLVDFKEKDLLKIKSLTRLSDLYIKTATIKNLDGVEGLDNLHSLNIANCKNLNSIKAVNHLTNLKEVHLEGCPNITDYDTISDLPKLEILSLVDCGKVQSLKFIKEYPLLQKLSLLGNTIVVDGDLFPAQHIRFLEHNHYSHYNLRLKNPIYEENVRNNMDKLKRLFKKDI